MGKFTPYQSGRKFLEPTAETFRGIEAAIQWAEVEVPRQLRYKMNELCFHMAILNQGFARKMSYGPSDPSGGATEFHELTGHKISGLGGFSKQGPTYKSSPAAWQIPVRRITGRYYLGWKVRSIGVATWQLYNDSREAYYIEFGIHTSLRRVRRPIRKLSLMQTMNFMMRTEAYHRIWIDIYANPAYRRLGLGFEQHVSGAGAALAGGGNLKGAHVSFTGPFVYGQTQRVARSG
jgi:hypothetical protein